MTRITRVLWQYPREAPAPVTSIFRGKRVHAYRRVSEASARRLRRTAGRMQDSYFSKSPLPWVWELTIPRR
jgi:hypothetical protein